MHYKNTHIYTTCIVYAVTSFIHVHDSHAVASCSEIYTCDQCQANPGCGWCNNKENSGLGKCLPGGVKNRPQKIDEFFDENRFVTKCDKLQLVSLTMVTINRTVVLGCTGGGNNESWYLKKGNVILINDGRIHNEFRHDGIHINQTKDSFNITFEKFKQEHSDIYICIRDRASSNRLDLRETHKKSHEDIPRKNSVEEAAFNWLMLIDVLAVIIGSVFIVIVLVVICCRYRRGQYLAYRIPV